MAGEILRGRSTAPGPGVIRVDPDTLDSPSLVGCSLGGLTSVRQDPAAGWRYGKTSRAVGEEGSPKGKTEKGPERLSETGSGDVHFELGLCHFKNSRDVYESPGFSGKATVTGFRVGPTRNLWTPEKGRGRGVGCVNLCGTPTRTRAESDVSFGRVESVGPYRGRKGVD